MIIKNAKVFLLKGSVNGSIKEDGFIKIDIQIENKKIKSLGDIKSSSDEEIVDGSGKYLTPGYIDAHSHLGLYEVATRWELDNTNEITNPKTPTIRAIDGIKPNHKDFREAIKGGVTTVCTGPGSTNVIGGEFAVISTHGRFLSDMVINGHYAMKCAFGENTKQQYGQVRKTTPVTRMGVAEVLRRTLFETIIYKEKKENAKKNGVYFDKDFFYESMLPVISREIPLKAHAHRADDMATAIRIAREFNLKMTLDHGTEAHLIADYIKESGFPVINGPTFGSLSKQETINKSLKTASVLYEKGVKFAIMTDHPFIPQSELGLCAMLASKNGLPETEAIKAITISPAEILGIESFKGKIEIGYDADVVLWSDRPLSVLSNVCKAIIGGECVV